MKCKLCGSAQTEVCYEDYIRDGAFGVLTQDKVQVYVCKNCDTYWHEIMGQDCKSYYESAEYRRRLERSADVETYYRLHDGEVLDKLRYTGTEVFRSRTVADVGCGGGSFLDFVKGAARQTVAVEPSLLYREELKKKGHQVYGYLEEAVREKQGAVDFVTSFDVIEHVEEPQSFLSLIGQLLKPGGSALVGTPSDAPVMRRLLGKVYEQFLFSTQHLWIFSDKSLRLMAQNAGFSRIAVGRDQRYGLGNVLAWLVCHKPAGDTAYDFIDGGLDELWKDSLKQQGVSDYLLLRLQR